MLGVQKTVGLTKWLSRVGGTACVPRDIILADLMVEARRHPLSVISTRIGGHKKLFR